MKAQQRLTCFPIISIMARLINKEDSNIPRYESQTVEQDIKQDEALQAKFFYYYAEH
jgi:hypothetical protein